MAGLIAGPAPAWYLWAVAAAGLAFSVTQILGLGWTLSFPLPLAVGLLAGVEAALAASVLSSPPQDETQLVIALLKERSPSCGSGQIYDGTFTKTLTQGDGLTAQMLKKHGITVYGESQIEELIGSRPFFFSI